MIMKPALPPWPLIEVAIEPKRGTEREKLCVALEKLASEDSSFQVLIDRDDGRIVLGGTGELHLDIKVGILHRTYDLDTNVSAPQVACRETITRKAEIDYTHKTTTGTSDQFTRLRLVIESDDFGKGFAFESKVAGDAVPEEYLAGIEAGLGAVISSGILAGFPVTGIKVQLTDCRFDAIHSSAEVFEIASRVALREALLKAGPKLLEPVMQVEVVSPEDCVDLVVSDLKSRRGRIKSQDMRDISAIVDAMVPLANTFDLVTTLRSRTKGRAIITIAYAGYEPVPDPDNPQPPPAVAAALTA